jgi:purine catabolism regulator
MQVRRLHVPLDRALAIAQSVRYGSVAVRVSELLEIDFLQGAGVHVVAGADRLDNEVRWVHTGEIADIAKYLSGGEALLTAATGLRGTEADRRRYVRELAEARVSCVIIELGRSFDEIPREMIDEAAHTGLVLVALDHEVPFVAVTQRAHTMLVSAAHATLQRAIEIDDALNALILEGAPLSSVLNLLAERLHNPVILEDGSRRVVAYGGAQGSVTPLLSSWQTHSRQGHRVDRSASVQYAQEPHVCAWSVISVRGEDWGRLHAVEIESPLGDLARLSLGRAAASIALFLMGERDAMLSDVAEASLVRGLVHVERFDSRDFLARAGGLGVDLDADLVVMIIGPGPNGEALEAEALATVVDDVRQGLRKSSWPAVVGSLGGAVAVVAKADPTGGLDRAAKTLAASLQAATGRALQIGVSHRGRAGRLPQAQVEASAAHRLGPLAGDGPAHFYDALVLYRLLSPLAAGPGLANFVEAELGPLLSYENQHPAELLRTLDAYLKANGNKITTAKMLHLQRRSVYYRLERIEQLLGRSLNDPEQRVRLYIALRAHDILELGIGTASG